MNYLLVPFCLAIARNYEIYNITCDGSSYTGISCLASNGLENVTLRNITAMNIYNEWAFTVISMNYGRNLILDNVVIKNMHNYFSPIFCSHIYNF